jgi:excisionase family DNA binding protein
MCGRYTEAKFENAVMEKSHSTDRLMKILQASPAQLAAIDRVLDGSTEPPRPERKGPFLLKMGDAAALLGVSRPTLWRMLNVGRLTRVEILPATYRVRREEVEEIAFGKSVVPPPK